MTTPADDLGAVNRTLSTVDRDGVETKQLTATRTYPTDIADLWDALTDPDWIPRWFLPISGEVRVGGRYQLEGTAGGEILACEPPNHVAITWEYGDQVSWVDLHLSGDEHSATLDLVHVASVDQEIWAEFGPGAVGIGWELGLMGLADHPATGATVDPAVAAAWSTSPDGIAFITGSSIGWGEAAIAAGDDADQARAAAGRSTAVYTATEQPAHA